MFNDYISLSRSVNVAISLTSLAKIALNNKYIIKPTVGKCEIQKKRFIALFVYFFYFIIFIQTNVKNWVLIKFTVPQNPKNIRDTKFSKFWCHFQKKTEKM